MTALSTMSKPPKTARLSLSDIFCDESHFCLVGDNQRIHVWRHRDQRQDDMFVACVTEGLVPLHLHPYRTVCSNCVRTFELHKKDCQRTQLGTSTTPCQDVMLTNMVAWRHTKRHYFCRCSSINITHISLNLLAFIIRFRSLVDPTVGKFSVRI